MPEPGQLHRQYFVLVIVPFELHIDLPVELIPGRYLREAQPFEAKEIMRHVACSNPFFARTLYRTNLFERPRSRPVGEVFATIDEWRYLVLASETPGPHEQLRNLELVGNITRPEIQLGAGFAPGLVQDLPTATGIGLGVGPYLVQHLLGAQEAMLWTHLVKTRQLDWRVPLTSEGVADIRRSYDTFVEVKDTHPWVPQTITMLQDLRSLPRDHAMYTLGLFTVLEALALRRPTHDVSLTEQLIYHMDLLEERFDVALDASGFSRGLDAVAARPKLWRALYQLRSRLAHGEQPEFTSGRLKALGSQERANEFLRACVVSILRLAVSDPDNARTLMEAPYRPLKAWSGLEDLFRCLWRRR